MLHISIPDNNISEREYIIKIILSDILGLNYTININKSNPHYSICFDNSELIIKDCFFSLYQDDLSYLSVDALPKEITFTINDFIIEYLIHSFFQEQLIAW